MVAMKTILPTWKLKSPTTLRKGGERANTDSLETNTQNDNSGQKPTNTESVFSLKNKK